MNLEALAKLATEATPPEDCYLCGHPEHDHHHSAVPRWCGSCKCKGYHGVALTALHVAASPDVVLALVRVALAGKSIGGFDPTSHTESDAAWIFQTFLSVLRAALADLDR